MKISKFYIRVYSTLLLLTLIITTNLIFPSYTLAIDDMAGKQIFLQHCSGCHVNGGNIIRRGKTLKLAALKRNGIDNPEAIAKIARIGTGSMSGYEKVLEKGQSEVVGKWIWEQAQNAWIQG